MSASASDLSRGSRNPFRAIANAREAFLLLVVVNSLIALSLGCTGVQGGVEFFPQHDASFSIDNGKNFFAGQLVLEGGCLRVRCPDSIDRDAQVSRLVVWPSTFSVSAEGGSVGVVDSAGRIAARVGDHVRFGGDLTSSQAARAREIEQVTDCPGPLFFVGDEVTAFSLDGPTSLTLDLPEGELHFRRQEGTLGGQTSWQALAVGELVLDGSCLRLKAVEVDEDFFIVWPPGFTPHLHRGTVHVRNGGGRIIAQVGDELTMGGGTLAVDDDETGCPGPVWLASSIRVLPEAEFYFPRHDGSLKKNEEMERYVGRLLLDGRCLLVDSIMEVSRPAADPGDENC